MLLERLFDNLSVEAEVFSTCRVAPGWRLRLPALDEATLHFVLQGTGGIRRRNETVTPLPTGSLAVVPPHQVHLVECGPDARAEASVGGGPSPGPAVEEHVAGPSEEAELVVVCGRIEAGYGRRMGLFEHLREILVLDFSDDAHMRTTFEALREEQRNPGPGSRHVMTALMNDCLVHVFRRLCGHPDCRLPWLEALEDPDLARVIDTILEHPERDHTVEKLASLAHMSRSAFARRFREHFGHPPMTYVKEVRLRKAARLLRSDPPLPVSRVARRVGYSRSHFSRLFSDFFDCAPSEFGERA